jgi:hypothetical protein
VWCSPLAVLLAFLVLARLYGKAGRCPLAVILIVPMTLLARCSACG